ncbi:MAG: type II toxin-antitoxin system HicA family toxin [Bacteroidales bacterium]|nr:type II toxin-antitoxin system HicA family toxin [Bacteroidales bacterium]
MEKIMRKHGCYPLKAGGKQDQWYSPITKSRVVMPRHYASEVPIGTFCSILKQAGIKL